MKNHFHSFQTLCSVLAVLIFSILFSNSALAGTFTASVDRNQLGSGETFELRLRFDEQTSQDPDLSPLMKDFEVLSRNQQNQYSFTNGTSVSFTEWRIQLLPKQVLSKKLSPNKSRDLTIPALELKGVSTKPIRLKITDNPISSQKDQPVYVETELDKNSLYVQEQLLLTLRVLSKTNLQSISSDDLVVENADMIKVAENQFQKQINGINHLVIELKYALYPNTSGQLTIPALRFNLVIPERRDPYSRSFFSRGGKRVFLHSEEKTVTVNPRPSNYGSGEWLPSKGVSLTERWSRPLDELVAGEPVTRTILFTARGSTSAQLPPLEINTGNGFKTYPDQPQLNDEVDSNGVTATRLESIAIVPSRGGQLTLPPITVKWWDTTTNQVRETTLDATTLNVKPAANAANMPSPLPAQDSLNSTENNPATMAATDTNNLTNQNNSNHSMLLWLLAIGNIVLFLALTVMFILWRKSKHSAQLDLQPASEQQQKQRQKETVLFKQLKQSAKQQDHQIFRKNLLTWARAYWQQPFVTLDQVAILANRPTLKAQLDELNAALYSSGASLGDSSDDSLGDSSDKSKNIDLFMIVDELQNVIDEQKKQNANKGNHLKPLYG